MKRILQQFKLSLTLITALVFSMGTVQAQVYASWNMTGQTGFGTSPIAPTFVSTDAVVTENLTRSAGFTTTQGTAPAQTNRWGGRTAAANVTTALGGSGGSLRVFTFAIKPQTGSTLSFGSISPISVWVSSTSPLNYLMQYSLDGTAYTDIITHTITATAQSLKTIPQTDLSSITALQNVPASQTIWFRIVPYGGSSSGDFNFVYFTAPTNISGSSGGNANSFAVTGPITLPVKLTSFTSSVVNNEAKLNWKTSTEVNFDYFSVEKRNGNGVFEEIAKVSPKAGTGEKLYSYTDRNLSFETSYYRLKMVDNDGTFEYSEVVSATIVSQNTLAVYPNPVNNSDVIRVQFKELPSASTLKVIDIAGRTIKTLALQKGVNQASINANDLDKGQYVLLLETENKVMDYIKLIR